MATRQLVFKSDADILTILKSVDPSVSAFSWIDGNPQIVGMSSGQEVSVQGVLQSPMIKEWVTV